MEELEGVDNGDESDMWLPCTGWSGFGHSYNPLRRGCFANADHEVAPTTRSSLSSASCYSATQQHSLTSKLFVNSLTR